MLLPPIKQRFDYENAISYEDFQSIVSQTASASTGISTCCPSPTRLRLGLGPDLPWDDDRCPGTLRLSVEGILTLLFAAHTGILSSCLSTCPSGQASPMQERSPTQLTYVNCQSFGSVL